MFRPSVSRIPLLFVWPGRIPGGQRFSQPVSMIDVLPTILDLLGLPEPEVVMGQSLAPLLLGEEGWEPRPVILDQFNVDQETGELRGELEVVDGRWAASLQINPEQDIGGGRDELVGVGARVVLADHAQIDTGRRDIGHRRGRHRHGRVEHDPSASTR